MRVANIAVGQAADVDQAAVGEANINERAEVDDIQHRPLQLHVLLQVF